MKKHFNRIKAFLTVLRIAIINIPFKAMGQMIIDPVYAPPQYFEEKFQISFRKSATNTSFKIIQGMLIGITLVVGIINFIKIRKIDDKALKKKKVKKTIIILSILMILIIACFITTWLLKK